MAITIHGAGCALMDFLFRGVDFTSPTVARLLEQSPGDGGLTIGGLVFAEALERFAGRPVGELLRSIAGDREPDRRNVGGPAIVSLIHTAQLLPQADVLFHGAVGADQPGRDLVEIVARTPLDSSALAVRSGETAATWVLSDPDYGDGHGERLFINRLGVAAGISAADLGPEFPQADIVQLGGTALVPQVHDALPELLAAARREGALTVVNTVYDFRSQMRAPGERWTLGSDESYPLIDLLVTDAEEAHRLTGYEPRAAVAWFLARGVGAAVVTRGPEPVVFAARGGRFGDVDASELPVLTEFAHSDAVRGAGGDTTGCGDTFVGGLVAGIAEQMDAASAPGASAGRAEIELGEAVRLGIASGAFCLTHLGGTWIESRAGEKRERVAGILERWDERAGS